VFDEMNVVLVIHVLSWFLVSSCDHL